MSLGRFRPLLFSSFLLFLLAMSATAAAGSKGAGSAKAVNPYLNDPHSGAYLNREAARNPMQSPAALFGPGSRTILAGTVNDPTTDTTAQDTQSETTLTAISNKVLVGFNDSGSHVPTSNNHFTGYSRSANSGGSFTDKGTLPASAVGDAGDPNLAVDKGTGDIYFSTLGFSASNQIPVFKSTDSGVTFGAPVNGIPGGSDLDKSWIAVDNFAGTHNGDVYVCATDFGFSPARIVVTHSVDGGVTFAPSGGVILSNTGQSQGCNVAVGPDHSVYVAYFRGNAPNALFIRRSTDGGVTFGTEHQVATLNTTSTNGDLALNGGFRSNSFPTIAVNPTSGQVDVTYNDRTAPGNADIYATTSDDNGTTWSTPIVVNNDTGGDQFTPALAISPNGRGAFFSYYSRDDDSANLAFHRRGRLYKTHPTSTGVLTPSGRSFRLGPNNPPVIGQDPVINTVYMGDYDQAFAANNTRFYTSWADNRDGNSFHAHQPDVRFASIAASQPTTNVRVTLGASPSTIDAGHTTTITAHVRSSGGTANDVFLNMNPANGLTYNSVTSAGNDCELINKFVGCSMGDIPSGTVENVTVVATGGLPAGTRTVKANATTSSLDTNAADNTGTATVVVNPGSTTAKTYSSGNIAVPIPDNTTVDVPITVGPTGSIADVDAYVRLNHTFDSDLVISLISPLGTTVALANRRGGSFDNYGSGTNDCDGLATHFNDDAATPIAAGAAPFAGAFSPEVPLSNLNGEEESGTWKMRVADTATLDTGTIGCARIKITRFN